MLEWTHNTLLYDNSMQYIVMVQVYYRSEARPVVFLKHGLPDV